MSTLETISNCVPGLHSRIENVFLPVPPIQIKAPTTLTEAMNSEYSKEYLNAMKLEIESIKGNGVAVLTPLSNVPRNTKVVSTKCFFKVKPDGRFKARLVALGWRQRHVETHLHQFAG